MSKITEISVAENLQELLGTGRTSLRNRLIGRVVSVLDGMDLDERSRSVNKTLIRDTIHQLVDDAIVDSLFVVGELAEQRCREEYEKRFGARLLARRHPKTYHGAE